MARLIWGNPGRRFYEAGLDRGVLYPQGRSGVAWDGLQSVSEKSSGGTEKNVYVDGVHISTRITPESFAGNIRAFTYPDEFELCDGSYEVYEGLFAQQQTRLPFGLSYRTKVGSDTQKIGYSYKIHLVYNALTLPNSKDRSTVSNVLNPGSFSWDYITTPVAFDVHRRPASHFIINSSKIDPELLEEIESLLYGTDDSSPELPSIEQVVAAFFRWHTPLEITESLTTGLADLSFRDFPDLEGNLKIGLYRRPRLSRLEKEQTDGFYKLEK